MPDVSSCRLRHVMSMHKDRQNRMQDSTRPSTASWIERPKGGHHSEPSRRSGLDCLLDRRPSGRTCKKSVETSRQRKVCFVCEQIRVRSSGCQRPSWIACLRFLALVSPQPEKYIQVVSLAVEPCHGLERRGEGMTGAGRIGTFRRGVSVGLPCACVARSRVVLRVLCCAKLGVAE